MKSVYGFGSNLKTGTRREMRKRILVIDDEEAIREVFLAALKHTEYQVDTIDSGEKAIAMVERAKYNLVYLDLRMPGLNGVQTLRELRKKDKDVPIYIVTAFHAEFFDQLKSAEEDGVKYELLKKPIGPAQLITVTKGVLEEPIVEAIYELRLFLSSRTSRSEKAIEDLKALLEANYGGQYSLEIINVREDPEAAEHDQIIATPTVVKIFPPPIRRIVGDLSDKEKVFRGLGMVDLGNVAEI